MPEGIVAQKVQHRRLPAGGQRPLPHESYGPLPADIVVAGQKDPPRNPVPDEEIADEIRLVFGPLKGEMLHIVFNRFALIAQR